LSGGFGEVQYGAAMYVNKKPDYAVPGSPSAVVGPKIAYYRETRLRGFYPTSGNAVSASLVLSPARTDRSLVELGAAQTFSFGDYVYWTLEGRGLAAGKDGFSLRGESRLDVPLGGRDPNEDQAEIFVRLRGGHDVYEDVDLVGSAAIIGVRYHSSGFIAELALKLTKSPDELTPTDIEPKRAVSALPEGAP
jgi:hypothetical protein